MEEGERTRAKAMEGDNVDWNKKGEVQVITEVSP